MTMLNGATASGVAPAGKSLGGVPGLKALHDPGSARGGGPGLAGVFADLLRQADAGGEGGAESLEKPDTRADAGAVPAVAASDVQAGPHAVDEEDDAVVHDTSNPALGQGLVPFAAPLSADTAMPEGRFAAAPHMDLRPSTPAPSDGALVRGAGVAASPGALTPSDVSMHLGASTEPARSSGLTDPRSPVPLKPDFEATMQQETAKLATDADQRLQRAIAPGADLTGVAVSQWTTGAPTIATALRAFGMPRAGERVNAHAQTDVAGPDMRPWSDAQAWGAHRDASMVQAPGAGPAALASAFGEKLHFWVAQGVQSAQFQLDGLAGGSVDVKIAVRGGEAYVEFRTDQQPARQLLQDAMSHLKELLATDGMMLSGSFVGGSGQHDSARQNPERRQRAEPSAGLDATGKLPAASAMVAVRGTGRAVDLFV